MEREIVRTLTTLSSKYQNFASEDYEVIIVDNGSAQKLASHQYTVKNTQVRYFYLENASASPAAAINFGIKQSKGDIVGIMVDGARMASPGILKHTAQAFQLYDNPVVSTIGFHLGYEKQQISSSKGYNQEAEDKLLESIDWQSDGHTLFDIACLAGSSAGGWFANLPESNCFFAHKKLLQELGGADEQFQLSGGGLVNLDLYKRVVEAETVQNIRLLGEATFHQYHGGASTKTKAKFSWQDLQSDHSSIKGEEFKAPKVDFQVLGHLPTQLNYTLRRSANAWSNRQMRNRFSKTHSKGIIILGMHRSGTSMLTGVLEEAGLYLGDVINKSPYNKKGNKESKFLWKVNNTVLEYAGASWDRPSKNPNWIPVAKDLRDQYLLRFVGQKLWGFKDPRVVLTLDGWLEAIPNYQLIGLFRHPFLVAQSLYNRGKMPLEDGLQLWLEYNWRIIYHVKNNNLKMIEFTTDQIELKRQMDALIEFLQLPNPKEQYDFFDNSLRHVKLPVMEGVRKGLQEQCVDLYFQMKELVFCKKVEVAEQEQDNLSGL